jgi:hypothetical protein
MLTRSSPDDRLDSSTLFRIKPDELSGSGSYPSNPRAAEGLESQFLSRKLRRLNTSHILNFLLVGLIICRNKLRNASELFTIAFLLTSRMIRVHVLFFFVA